MNFLLLVGLVTMFSFSCANNNAGKTVIGVAMPTKSSQRWIDDGKNMVKSLEKLGYVVDLQYAEDVVENQVSQVENMIMKKVKVLVIASVDGSVFTDSLSKAKEAGIPVVAYDRLLTNSADVDYYATFDNFKVGVLQGSYIVDKLGLKEGKGPFNIEVFGGSPDDNNAYFFYDGALSILQPYIDSGKLVVRSGQLGMAKVSTLRWDGSLAQNRMDTILSTYYSDGKLDAVYSPFDGISIGIISSLKSMGFGQNGKSLPLVTGQDSDLASVKSIVVAKEQTQTIFKNTAKLAEVTANMVDAIVKGSEVEVNDTKTYNNGKKVVPSFLLDPLNVDISNWKEVLVSSGYYTEEQILK